MASNIILIPTHEKVGLMSVAMGLVRNLEQQNIQCNFFAPLSINDGYYREYAIVKSKHADMPYIPFHKVTSALLSGNINMILQDILGMYERLQLDQGVVVIKGLPPNSQYPFVSELNTAIAKALNADIVFVTSLSGTLNELNETIEIAYSNYHSSNKERQYGCIINKIGQPCLSDGILPLEERLKPSDLDAMSIKKLPVFTSKKVELLGEIEWSEQLHAPRVIDIVDKLNATVIYEGHIHERRICYLKLCARSVNTVMHILASDTLIITAGDRADIVAACALAELTGLKISGIILTGENDIRQGVLDLCQPAFESGLPVLHVKSNSFETASLLSKMDTRIQLDDHERIDLVKDTIAHRINTSSIIQSINKYHSNYITPPAFMYKLLNKSKKHRQRILLPEGNDDRILLAAHECAEKNIAEIILFAQEEKVKNFYASKNMTLSKYITIIDPDTIRNDYIESLCQVRKHKNMTPDIAKDWLTDDTVLATLMLHQGDTDGLVAGATTSTANTIRPALQIIKTQPGINKVSSLFFMCLPESVLVFADCAISPNPDSDELVDIALMASTTAQQFNINPRVAMLSYSTGESGLGSDVDKVKLTTEKIKVLRPELLIDGPLQYDAAINPDVAAIKAPGSQVAGNANVLIFPDLNTGNTTYKAVQRSANIICIGPVLMGLNKPVNDLSRGCSIKDIVYTIAITAVQSQASPI